MKQELFVAHVITTALSLGLAGLCIYLTFVWDETMILIERLGLGVLGGAVLLSIAFTWTQMDVNPSTIWYQWLWRAGIALFLSGKVHRLRRHWRGNQIQNDIARSYYGERLTYDDGTQKEQGRKVDPETGQGFL